MNAELRGKTVLVTGGAGSIGSEIVKQLLDYDVSTVIVLSRDEIKHFVMKKNILDSRLRTIIGDVRDIRNLERVFQDYHIDLIYNTAAMKHVVVCEEFPTECVLTNVLGTQNVVDMAKKYKILKLINISTDKAACPVNAMGASKFIAERVVFNANYSCVRFGNVANSRGSVIPVFVDNLINRKPIVITDPNVTRFIMEIPDAVKLVMKATTHAIGGEIFILKMKAFRLGDLLKVMLERIAPKMGIPTNEIEVKTVGLIPGEKMHEDLINTIESNHIYELGDMYLILKDEKELTAYKDAKKVNLGSYSSNNADYLSHDKLEQIILKHINKLRQF